MRDPAAAPAPMRAPLAVALLTAAAALALWWDGRAVFDDAFITYQYARNWVAGNGIVYNPGERVEGFTNPAWVALAALALRLGIDPLLATRALGVASFVLAAAGSAFVLARRVAPCGRAALGLAPALLALFAPAGLASVAGSGLETAFVALCLLALGASLLLPDADPRARALRLVLPAIAVWTRLDAAPAVGACALAMLAARAAAERRAARRAAGEVLGSLALAVAALEGFRLAYYGAWLPNSYYAKGADEWHLHAGLLWLGAFVRSAPQAPVLLGFTAFAALRAEAPAHRRFALHALLATLAHAAYVAKVGGDFMQYRFAWQIYPLLAAAGLAGAAEPAARWLRGDAWQRGAAFALAWGIGLLSLAPPVYEERYGMQSVAEMDSYTRLGQRVGRALRRQLPPGTVVATTLAGTIAYESGLPVVDQWALSDREGAREPAPGAFSRGHYKPASAALLRRRGVELALRHPRLCACDDPCTEPVPMLFVRVDARECVQGFLVAPRPALLERACNDGRDLIVHGVDCAPLRRAARR